MDTYEKKIREYMNNGEVDELYKNMLLNLFPELKESEDERIRKGLIKAVSRTFEGNKLFGTDVTREEALAWLEKQGEPMEINPTEFDTRLQTLIGKFDNLPKEELIGSLSFWLNVVQNDGTYKNEEKQGEQKPQRMISAEAKEAMYDKPTWSEYDELVVKDIEEAITNYWHGQSQEDLLDWLKSLKQRIEGE